MCELFGMSSARPATINYSLKEFAKHGGLTHLNRSGWGIGYIEDCDVRLIKEAREMDRSPWVDFIAKRRITSHTVIAHVRYASVGARMLENCHPFRQELGGRMHLFAHNGTLKDAFARLPFEGPRYRPLGQTDSEHAFCVLLQRLELLWTNGRAPPDLDKRIDIVSDFAADLRRLGTANFLYSDGDTLFGHAHRRVFDDGGVFSAPRPPGLTMLHRPHRPGGQRLDTAGLSVEMRELGTTLLASVPLTDEDWIPLSEGAVVAIRDGQVVEPGPEPARGSRDRPPAKT
jgi:predicted glutamine amidotransferase